MPERLKRLLIVGILGLCAACTPSPTATDALARANREFLGKDINGFIISYGAPTGVMSSNASGKVYRWVSIEPGSGRSVSLARSGNYTIPDISSQGVMTSGFCEIRIRTDADDYIKQLTLVQDSIGKYSGSRCAEIFSQAP